MKKTITFFVIILSLFTKGENLFVTEEGNKTEVRITKNLDEIYSDKKLGSFIKDNKTVFRLFAPNAIKVVLCLFENVGDVDFKSYEMKADENGVWEVIIDKNLNGKFYGYKVFHKNDNLNLDYKPLCVDPYAKAVASYTSYLNPRKSIVYEDDYDWEGDTWIKQDWRDLIIYEMHIRDLTADNSSGAKEKGTYKGLIEKGIKGGLEYIKTLGVNTVELLPSMEFGVCEIPYKDSLNGKFNTWNPYERNHWGYMTSNFFAPAAYYSYSWDKFQWNRWIGEKGNQVKEFKDMVKAFHKNGIAVMMDVVFNHLSEYELGNLKEIDKEYYFRLDDNGNFIAESYCGNDLKTERPMMRRLIVESILYWMTEYHIDGFRFDLGNLIDKETLKLVITEARKINPNVVFTAEPWGGGYDPQGFSDINWASWNDQIRNGIKGENPFNGQGWIFGKFYGNNDKDRIKSYVNGTLRKDKFGLFKKKEHSVNYLESHDGYTLGDFIRIGSGQVNAANIIEDIDKHAKLTGLQMKLNKLAAAFLFTSQGITMIHEGQEFARSKVIPSYIDVDDKEKGKIDHNSYNKDNETNYINYQHAELNKDLIEYYKGLILLRKTYPAFRRADYNDIKFIDDINNPFFLMYKIDYDNTEFLVVFNANQNEEFEYQLPEGKWKLLVNGKKVNLEGIEEAVYSDKISPIEAKVYINAD